MEAKTFRRTRVAARGASDKLAIEIEEKALPGCDPSESLDLPEPDPDSRALTGKGRKGVRQKRLKTIEHIRATMPEVNSASDVLRVLCETMYFVQTGQLHNKIGLTVNGLLNTALRAIEYRDLYEKKDVREARSVAEELKVHKLLAEIERLRERDNEIEIEVD